MKPPRFDDDYLDDILMAISAINSYTKSITYDEL